MTEQKGGKWAAEVYDFFQLFRRINASIYGLLIIELGWVLLLVLIEKLTPSAGNTPITPEINIPWSNSDILVSNLLLPGAIIFMIGWIFWSGLWLYVWLPLRQILRRVAIVLLWTIVTVGVLINIPLLVISYPIERWLAWNWIRKTPLQFKEEMAGIVSKKKKAEIELENLVGNESKIIADIGVDDAEKMKAGQLSTEDKKRIDDKLAQKAMHEYVIEQIGFSRWFVVDFQRKRISPLIIALTSRAYIGLAPLQSFSYEEDLNASKAPSQVFSTAIQRLYWKLGKNRLLRHIRFENLPMHFVPKNVNEARLMRRLLGLDVLVWGSYLKDDVNKVWLNIDNNQKPALEKDDDEDKQDKNIPRELFNYFPDLSHKMTVIDQSAIWDVYVALALTVIQTVQSRSKDWKDKMDWQSRDVLYFGALHMEAIVDDLVQDVFMQYKGVSDGVGKLYPSPRRILAGLAGEWVGQQIHNAERYESSENLANSLLPIMKQCIEIEPDLPENYYRLGFLYILKSCVEESVSTFARAKQFEPPAFFRRSSIIRAGIFIDREDLSSDISSNERPLAKAVASAARAINLGGDTEKEHIRTKFEKTGFYRMRKTLRKRQDDPTKDDFPAYHVLHKLLSKSYNPDSKTQK